MFCRFVLRGGKYAQTTKEDIETEKARCEVGVHFFLLSGSVGKHGRSNAMHCKPRWTKNEARAALMDPCTFSSIPGRQETDELIQLCDSARASLLQACDPVKKKPKTK